jgi:surface protein
MKNRLKLWLITAIYITSLQLLFNCKKDVEIIDSEYVLTLNIYPEDAGNLVGAGKYPVGYKVDISVTDTDGFKFINWKDSEQNEISNVQNFEFTMPEQDVTLTAYFEKDNGDLNPEYNLSLNIYPEDAGNLVGAGKYPAGYKVDISVTDTEGFKFINWKDAEQNEVSNVQDFEFTMPEQDVTLTAYFERGYTIFVIETTTEKTNYKFVVDEAINFKVDWGDGNTSNYNGDAIPEHNYDGPGQWEIKVQGFASRMAFFINKNDGSAFCKYAQMLKDILTPISEGIEGITSAKEMFKDTRVSKFSCDNFFDDVSGNITNMSTMFSFAHFNQDISNWDVSNVTDMSWMFAQNTHFNQNIGNWNVSSVTNMSGMFSGFWYETIFNQDISNWDVSNVENMSDMFAVSMFNQDINNWDVSNVTDMSGMFSNAVFNQYIGDWDVSNVTNMKEMFFSWYPSHNHDISNWDVSNVTDMTDMFKWGLMSTEYYNALLIQWSYLNLKDNVNFCAGVSKYDYGLPAERREHIVNTYNWTISDGGSTGSDYTD